MKKINWGIIGCGDVTEIKSGPAFNKVAGSALVAVMRRDAQKAKDYAHRHHVPKWYNDARQLIDDPEVNAVYIATPPLSHEEYTIAALQAGKPVYVEKPMATNVEGCVHMQEVMHAHKGKLSVAHYRRAQPMFKKIKSLLDENAIGEIKFVRLQLLHAPLSDDELQQPRIRWRVDPQVAGGGLFHDLAPHQLDLMYYFFGKIRTASGVAFNQGRRYSADDIVSGNILFENGIIFTGLWSFNAPADDVKEICTITGSAGSISFSIFGEPEVKMIKNGATKILKFEKLAHVQQPIIEAVVKYFSGEGPNPCPAQDAIEVMRVLTAFTLP